jgi:hypothetical protein
VKRIRTNLTIPDDVFAKGERLASVLNISRSELCQRAVVAYMDCHDKAGSEPTTREPNVTEAAPGD